MRSLRSAEEMAGIWTTMRLRGSLLGLKTVDPQGKSSESGPRLWVLSPSQILTVPKEKQWLCCEGRVTWKQEECSNPLRQSREGCPPEVDCVSLHACLAWLLSTHLSCEAVLECPSGVVTAIIGRGPRARNGVRLISSISRC